VGRAEGEQVCHSVGTIRCRAQVPFLCGRRCSRHVRGNQDAQLEVVDQGGVAGGILSRSTLLYASVVLKVCLFNGKEAERGMLSLEVAAPMDAAGEPHILHRDSHALGVYGTQDGVFEQVDEEGLGGFLQCEHRVRSESHVNHVVLGNLPHDALKGELGQERHHRGCPRQV